MPRERKGWTRPARGASCAMMALALFFYGSITHGQARYSEAEVKAAFLFRFTGYVDWPAPMLEAPSFTIAVLGQTEVADELERLVPGRSIKNLPARVRHIHSVKEIGDAQMLYIAARYPDQVKQAVQQLGSKPVLVVSDHPRGLENGAMVNFLMLDRRVRFEISVAASDRAHLKIGAELLSLATRVLGGQNRAQTRCSSSSPPCTCIERRKCMERLARL